MAVGRGLLDANLPAFFGNDLLFRLVRQGLCFLRRRCSHWRTAQSRPPDGHLVTAIHAVSLPVIRIISLGLETRQHGQPWASRGGLRREVQYFLLVVDDFLISRVGEV